MKVIARIDEDTVLVQMSVREFFMVGPEDSHWEDRKKLKPGYSVDVRRLTTHLTELERNKPDLKQLRAVMQTFLALTDPESIAETLRAAGVVMPEPDPTEATVAE